MRSGSSEIDSEIKQNENSIVDLNLPPGMHQLDTATFYDQTTRIKSQIRLKITALNKVKQNIKTRCLNYAIKIEKQLEAQNKNQSFLTKVQTDVNNHFKLHSETVYSKLLKTSQLIDTNDQEDNGLLLTSVRRSIKAAADYFYPPETGLRKCSDGKERELGEEQYLNRLQEFIITRFPKSTSRELLQAELENLSVYIRRLNDVASKGVHSDVDSEEAKQGFLGLYFFLYNIISRLNSD